MAIILIRWRVPIKSKTPVKQWLTSAFPKLVSTPIVQRGLSKASRLRTNAFRQFQYATITVPSRYIYSTPNLYRSLVTPNGQFYPGLGCKTPAFCPQKTKQSIYCTDHSRLGRVEHIGLGIVERLLCRMLLQTGLRRRSPLRLCKRYVVYLYMSSIYIFHIYMYITYM